MNSANCILVKIISGAIIKAIYVQYKKTGKDENFWIVP